ncbi:PA1571 family protein [Kaarinaea lacus]
MKQRKNTQEASAEYCSPTDFYGASIITESGAEIPITEKMLQLCFKALIDAWEQSRLDRQT